MRPVKSILFRFVATLFLPAAWSVCCFYLRVFPLLLFCRHVLPPSDTGTRLAESLVDEVEVREIRAQRAHVPKTVVCAGLAVRRDTGSKHGFVWRSSTTVL